MNTQVDRDVVVIGAGLSGLYAATLLKEAGLSVVVIEARNRVGGLTYSPNSEAYGGRVDLGGQWVSPKHKRIHRLIQKYSVPLVKQFVTGQRACVHGKETFVGAMGTVPGLTDEEQAGYKAAYARLYEAMDAIAPNPWESADAAKLDSMTYASWVNSICEPGKVHAAMTRIPGAYYGALAEEVSALELLQKLKSCGGPVFMSDTESGGQSAHMMGTQIASEGMASDLRNDIVLSAPVRAVNWRADGATVHTDAGAWRSRFVVFATSPTMINQIHFTPNLPSKRRMLHQRFPNGRNTKMVIVYDRPFWRDKNLNGNVISTDGSLTAVYDLGDENSTKGILITLFTGLSAYRVDHLSPTARKARLLELLTQAFGPEAQNPTEYMEQVWADEEWSGGASSPFLVPGALTTIGGELREPVGPLHWAGTHMSAEYRGYLEGALSAGEAAAKRIAAGL
jgi:monoamine oxidase